MIRKPILKDFLKSKRTRWLQNMFRPSVFRNEWPFGSELMGRIKWLLTTVLLWMFQRVWQTSSVKTKGPPFSVELVFWGMFANFDWLGSKP